MRNKTQLFWLALAGATAARIVGIEPAMAGTYRGYAPDHPVVANGMLTPTRYRYTDGQFWPKKPWKYPSTYPYAIPATYNAGPGNYYPNYHAKFRQARHARWTGYPPRHYFIVDYNGYAPPYGYYGN